MTPPSPVLRPSSTFPPRLSFVALRASRCSCRPSGFSTSCARRRYTLNPFWLSLNVLDICCCNRVILSFCRPNHPSNPITLPSITNYSPPYPLSVSMASSTSESALLDKQSFPPSSYFFTANSSSRSVVPNNQYLAAGAPDRGLHEPAILSSSYIVAAIALPRSILLSPFIRCPPTINRAHLHSACSRQYHIIR